PVLLGEFRTPLSDAAADGQPQVSMDPLTNRINTNGFEYDAAGNLTRLPRRDGSVLLLQYDGLGRVALVQRTATEIEKYNYNYNDQMNELRRTDGSVRYSVWSGDE